MWNPDVLATLERTGTLMVLIDAIQDPRALKLPTKLDVVARSSRITFRNVDPSCRKAGGPEMNNRYLANASIESSVEFWLSLQTSIPSMRLCLALSGVSQCSILIGLLRGHAALKQEYGIANVGRKLKGAHDRFFHASSPSQNYGASSTRHRHPDHARDAIVAYLEQLALRHHYPPSGQCSLHSIRRHSSLTCSAEKITDIQPILFTTLEH